MLIRLCLHFWISGYFRLCIDGIWQHILVDDYFPCRAYGHTMLFATGRKNQLWVSLVEKALAKAYGSYSTLHGGISIDGLIFLKLKVGQTEYPFQILFIFNYLYH